MWVYSKVFGDGFGVSVWFVGLELRRKVGYGVEGSKDKLEFMVFLCLFVIVFDVMIFRERRLLFYFF